MPDAGVDMGKTPRVVIGETVHEYSRSLVRFVIVIGDDNPVPIVCSVALRDQLLSIA